MLVNRKLYPEIPPKVEYSLTALGESLMLPLDGIIQWALEHSDEILKHRNKMESIKKSRIVNHPAFLIVVGRKYCALI